MQKLIRAVRVRAWAEHPGNAKLSLRKLVAEHGHERDRAAFSQVHGRLAKVLVRSALECTRKPRLELGRVPAIAPAVTREAHLRAVGRILLEHAFDQCGCGL